MNILLILIKRELFKIKNSIFVFFAILLFTPLFLYLFLTIPLSYVINIKPLYLYWSSGGIWIVGSLIISYLFSFYCFKTNLESDSFKSLPIVSWQHLISNYIFSTILGILQLLVSMIILNAIVKNYLIFYNYLLLIVLIIPSLFIIASFAFIVYYFIQNKECSSSIHILIFIFLSFGGGAFIPLNYFPESYFKTVSYFPIIGTIANFQRVIKSENIFFSAFITDIFFVIVLFIITLFLCEKKIKDEY